MFSVVFYIWLQEVLAYDTDSDDELSTGYVGFPEITIQGLPRRFKRSADR
jgi:hypothetical protein